MSKQVQLTKKIYETNTYQKVIDPTFTEFVTASLDPVQPILSVSEFFDYYQQLFYDIPVEGEINSHMYLVQQSQQYIGGSVIDLEKQALIEEINSLRQQILDLNQSFNTINNLL